MTIDLPEDLESSVRAEVLAGRYASEDDMIAEIVREYFRHKEQDEAADASADKLIDRPGRKPLWEWAAELRRSIPEEEWAKLTADGADQLDHYLYGSPKRPTS